MSAPPRARHDHGAHNHGAHDHRAHRHAQDHGHGHGGRHSHSHAHAPANFGAAFMVGAVLNIGFVAAEVGYGLAAHSTALLADAGHNFGDVLSLLAAWTANRLARRRPSERFTYGLGSSSVLAALSNAVMLLLVTGAVVAEAVRRLFEPAPVTGGIVIMVAALGMAVNGVTAALFASGRKGDLNVRGAFLHQLSDALVSAGVVVAGGLILLTRQAWIDPVASLVISAVILWGSWGLLKESLKMALDAVPEGISTAEVRAFLLGLDGVGGLHDLHIWAMSTTETALTCHLLMPAGHPPDIRLAEVCEALHHRFGIGHATIQVETDVAVVCRLEPAHVV